MRPTMGTCSFIDVKTISATSVAFASGERLAVMATTAASRRCAGSATSSRATMRPLLLMITATSAGRSTFADNISRCGLVTKADDNSKRKELELRVVSHDAVMPHGIELDAIGSIERVDGARDGVAVDLLSHQSRTASIPQAHHAPLQCALVRDLCQLGVIVWARQVALAACASFATVKPLLTAWNVQ